MVPKCDKLKIYLILTLLEEKKALIRYNNITRNFAKYQIQILNLNTGMQLLLQNVYLRKLWYIWYINNLSLWKSSIEYNNCKKLFKISNIIMRYAVTEEREINKSLKYHFHLPELGNNSVKFQILYFWIQTLPFTGSCCCVLDQWMVGVLYWISHSGVIMIKSWKMTFPIHSQRVSQDNCSLW